MRLGLIFAVALGASFTPACVSPRSPRAAGASGPAGSTRSVAVAPHDAAGADGRDGGGPDATPPLPWAGRYGEEGMRPALPAAPESFPTKVPVFGWLPPDVDCAMLLEEGTSATFRSKSERGTTIRPNPAGHPPRIVKTLGKCSAAEKALHLKAIAGTNRGIPVPVFSKAGSVVPHADIVNVLVPIDTPEKAALLALMRTEPIRWRVDDKGAHVEEDDPRYAKAKCVGCTTLDVRVVPDGIELLALRSGSHEEEGCHRRWAYFRTVLRVLPSGETTDVAQTQIGTGSSGFCVGRAPEGWAVARRRGPAVANAGDYFLALSRDEAASIEAFRRLACELRAHRAPQDLIRRAEEAARDEERHACAMVRLARLHGRADARVLLDDPPTARSSSRTGWPHRPSFGRDPVRIVRPLLTIATENAVEGCVHETYAALVACHQALYAVDEDVRAVMDRIAADETAHAELAWDVDAWCRRVLTTEEAAGLDAERSRAIRQLRRGLLPTPARWKLDSGEPCSASALAMADALWALLGAQSVPTLAAVMI